MIINKKLFSIGFVSITLILFFFISTFSTALASTAQPVDCQLSLSTQDINKLYGLDFSPFKDGQNPDYGSKVDRNQVIERLKVIAPYTSWIRTYGTGAGQEYIGPEAHKMGLKTAIGAWLSSDLEANNKEINELINESKAGYVDLAIVGSETLLRNDLSEDQLINYIKRVKEEAPGIKVTTGDTYNELIDHPKVMAECDVIFYNSYPYWEGVNINDSINLQDSRYKNIVNLAKNKTAMVSETGWPSSGNTIGSAVPSPENAAKYFNDFVSWARKNNVQYFYFEAFDETWKAIKEGPQGAHWGVWDKEGNMKPGMETVFIPNTKLPVAFFSATPTIGYAPLNVKFSDVSTGKPISWKWSFGDGTSSTAKSPVNIYSKTGKYTVSLTVTNAAGSNTTTKSNYIVVTALKPPVASFVMSKSSGKVPLTLYFTDKSTGIISSEKWSFGDGATSTVKNPSHKFTKVGKWKVTLTVANKVGSSSKYQYVTVIK